MKMKKFLFDHAKSIDVCIVAAIAVTLILMFFQAEPQGIWVQYKYAEWIIIAVLGLAFFVYSTKRDVFQSMIRQSIIKHGNKVPFRLTRKDFVGTAILLSKEDEQNYLENYTEINKRKWFRKMKKPSILVDIGNNQYVRCPLTREMRLVVH